MGLKVPFHQSASSATTRSVLRSPPPPIRIGGAGSGRGSQYASSI